MNSGDAAKTVLEKAQQKLHNDYLDYEYRFAKLENLSQESQIYIKKIEKEYKDFLAGKLDYSSLSDDAQFKANNKVTRAYMRRKIVKTNDRINSMARKTAGIGLEGNVNDGLIISSVNTKINNSFSSITGTDPILDELSIYGLHVLDEFKKCILNNFEEYDKSFEEYRGYNTVSLNNAINRTKITFKKYIENNEIDVEEIYFLRNKMTPDKASKVLENLNLETQEKCVKNCVFNKLPFAYKETNSFYKVGGNIIEKTEDKNQELYYDGPYGNPLVYEKGDYYTEEGVKYEGSVFKVDNSDKGEEFIFVDDTKNYEDKAIEETPLSRYYKR